MKCIKKHGEIKRVADSQAAEMIKKGWVYCPKHQWKQLRKKKG